MRVPQVGSDLVVAPDVADGWVQIEPGDRVVVGPTSLSRFVSQGTNIGWNATQPFDWGNGHILRVQVRYIAAPGA